MPAVCDGVPCPAMLRSQCWGAWQQRPLPEVRKADGRASSIGSFSIDYRVIAIREEDGYVGLSPRENLRAEVRNLEARFAGLYRV